MVRYILDENQRRTVLELDQDLVNIGRAPQLRRPRPRPARLADPLPDRAARDPVPADRPRQPERHDAQRPPRRPGRAAPGRRRRRRGREDLLRAGPAAGRTPRAATRSCSTSTDELARAREKADRLLRIQRVAKAVNSELHLDRLLAIILDHVIELAGAERAFLVLGQGGGGALRPRRAQLRARGGAGARGGVLARHRRAGVEDRPAGPRGERRRGRAVPGVPLDQRDPRAQRAGHPPALQGDGRRRDLRRQPAPEGGVHHDRAPGARHVRRLRVDRRSRTPASTRRTSVAPASSRRSPSS